VSDLENLGDRPGAEPSEIGLARESLRELIGDAVVTERDNGVFVSEGLLTVALYPEYKCGAEDAAQHLYTVEIKVA
jgi:hypothetical protein